MVIFLLKIFYLEIPLNIKNLYIILYYFDRCIYLFDFDDILKVYFTKKK
jgi:hypothetical protein